MAKYENDLDERLEKMVKDMANSKGLKEQGINVEAVRLTKGNTYGVVLKSNDLVTLFTNDPNIVCVALNEDLLIDQEKNDFRFRKEDINYMIDSLLAQISIDDKDKIKITKPEIHIPIGIAEQYKGSCLDIERSVIYTIQQIAEKKKEERERKKAEKAAKRKEKFA